MRPSYVHQARLMNEHDRPDGSETAEKCIVDPIPPANSSTSKPEMYPCLPSITFRPRFPPNGHIVDWKDYGIQHEK